MIGKFTTRAYDSREAFEAGTCSAIHVTHNRFTDTGLLWMWRMMAGELRNGEGGLTDHLGSARIVVGDGSQDFSPADVRLTGAQTAQSDLDPGFPAVSLAEIVGDEVDRVGRITLRATFGEADAAFDWQERGVVTAQGVLLDRAVSDQGRKVLGAIWECEATLDLLR